MVRENLVKHQKVLKYYETDCRLLRYRSEIVYRRAEIPHSVKLPELLTSKKSLAITKFNMPKRSVSLRHWYKFVYVKKVICAFQNVIFRKKYRWKYKHFPGTLPPVGGSKGITEVNGKELESSIHPYCINEGFISQYVQTWEMS